MILKVVISLTIILIFTGCGTKQDIDIDTTPKIQVVKQVEQPIRNKGALYSRRGASLFADKKDLQIGDIIQILIEETLTNDSSNQRTSSNSNASEMGGGVFTPIGTTSTQGTANKLNSSIGLKFDASSKSSFNGSAKTSADEEFTTTISAIIEQTYQNGNYFIKGTKQMLINGEKQIIKISGVIRPYDISPENTVFSYQLANLKILYDKEGEDADALKTPWGIQLLDMIWPF